MNALIFATLLAAGTSPESTVTPSDNEGMQTIVWLSVDGLDPRYLHRGETPTLDRLLREGLYSTEFIPVFPSLTFPSHVSQATGTKVAKHGIPGNSFISNTDWREHLFPSDSQLLQSEPIWNTATRQGVRVLVHDWPLSHAQRGEHAAAHFGDRFVSSLSDEQRLTHMVNTWAKDNRERGDREPLRLLMGYAIGPDSAGHAFGPESEQVIEKLEEVDSLLRAFLERAFDLWSETRGPDDELLFILTTDHGMSAVHSLVNLDYLAEIHNEPGVQTVTSGNIGHLFVRVRDPEMKQRAVANLVRRVTQHEFASAYAREDLPPQWQYDHPQRVGDVVVVLDSGYAFSSTPRDVTGPAADMGGPLGMHGYDPRTNPEMLGMMVMWRFPTPFGGRNLGQVHALQMHATVAELLGIEPADEARKDAVPIPARQPTGSR